MITTKTTGLTAQVYRGKYESTNGGLTNRVNGVDEVTVLDDAINGPFEPNEKAPAVRLIRRMIGGTEYIHAVPFGFKDHEGMFGGNFIYTSDSRLRNVCQYPIPVHDRKEG